MLQGIYGEMENKNTLKTNQELMQSRPIQVNRGLFQDDSFLPLLFCIVLIPLTHELSRPKCWYHEYGTERKISHFYIHG
jgi:hypothetical protein